MGLNYSGAYAAPRLDLGMAFMEHTADLMEFIGMDVLPWFRSPKKEATFSAITRESLLQDKDAQRAARAGYNRINSEATDVTFNCQEFGLEHLVDDSERSLYENDFDSDEVAAKILARALFLQYELRISAAVFNTTTWSGALFTDVSGSDPWDNIASPAIQHVLDAKEAVRARTGMIPNALIISEIQAKNLTLNTDIIQRFPGAPLITLEMIRQALVSIFGLTKLIVGQSVRNSAIEGQPFTGADVWNEDFAMVAIVSNTGDPLSVPCIGRSMLWVPDSPIPIMMEQYREEQARGDVFRARHSTDELVIDENFGQLIQVDPT